MLSLSTRWSQAWGFKSHWDTPVPARAGPERLLPGDSVEHELFYRLGRFAEIFVLPNPDYEPARRGELGVGVAVTTTAGDPSSARDRAGPPTPAERLTVALLPRHPNALAHGSRGCPCHQSPPWRRSERTRCGSPQLAGVPDISPLAPTAVSVYCIQSR